MTAMRIRRYILILSLCLPGGGFAAMDPVEPQKDPVLDEVAAATKRQDWASAAARLQAALAENPGSADYHNLYAYSIRKGPSPDMGLVFKHYHEALRLDPKHRGAHEYIGEAYLMIGNLAKAKEHLDALDRLCFFPCDEYTDLKKAIAEHERRQAAR
jgi:tetratricopeptide (TPR) repeat protein